MTICCGNERNCVDLARVEKLVKDHEKEVYKALLNQDKRIADIAIQRNEQLVCYTQGNYGNGKLMLIAGTGGKVFAIDNYNMSVSGNRDSLEVSHLERAFNGVKITDTNSVAWRVNVNTSGEVYTTKY